MVRLAILTCVIFATVANAFLVTPFHTCTKSTKGKAIFSTTRQKQNLLATSASTSTSTTESDNDDNVEPQVLATGYSQSMDMKEAIQEATEMALEALPRYSKTSGPQKIDLAIVSVSSLYDGSYSPAEVVPAVLEAASAYGEGIQHLVGSTVGGMISSMANTMDGPESSMTRSKPENVLEDLDFDTDEEDDDDVDDYDDVVGPMTRACVPVEREGVPSVSVMLAILPDVNVEVRFLRRRIVMPPCLSYSCLVFLTISHSLSISNVSMFSLSKYICVYIYMLYVFLSFLYRHFIF